MLSRTKKYWWTQIGGWGAYALFNAFLFVIFDKAENSIYWYRLIISVSLGVSMTHLMRFMIHKADVLLKPLRQQITGLFILTFVFATLSALIETSLLHIFNELWPTYQKNGEAVELHKVIFNNVFSAALYYFIWTCIYFIYHFIEKSRKQQLDTLRLEALVKELELKTIKSHINPHFIFNSLNSIRALVDENPQRARDAITELSNILRSSLKVEKMETVPLEKELSIIKDYLALETMRFEDRLKVEYEIDEDTLDFHVPPMMLQILVENAIKHGISKRINGGIVRIVSEITQNTHALIVQNTGVLKEEGNSDGFGLSSTSNRLSLLYGDQAVFNIKQANPSLVEAKLVLPIAHN